MIQEYLLDPIVKGIAKATFRTEDAIFSSRDFLEDLPNQQVLLQLQPVEADSAADLQSQNRRRMMFTDEEETF